MKKLYEQYIKIPKNKKISDSVFKSRIILSAVAILACLTMMLSSAFAFFSDDLTKKFKMTAATWDVCAEEIAVENEVHKFRLFRSRKATADKGYCIVIIREKGSQKNSDEYCTDVFKSDMILNIRMTDDYEAIFVPRWGDPRNYGFADSQIYEYEATIDHSHTEETLDEEDKTGSSSEVTENDSSSSGDFGEEESSEPDALPDKAETSEGEEESSDSSESSNESTEDSSEEDSSMDSDEGSSSTENTENTQSGTESESNTTGESGQTTETTSAPEQSSGDVDSSLSIGETSSSGSLPSESTPSAGSDSTSSSSSSSSGTSGSDGGSVESSNSSSDSAEASSPTSSTPSSGDISDGE